MSAKTGSLAVKLISKNGILGLMSQRGFTLVEVLVVVSIISLLSSITLETMGGARSRARDIQRTQDLRQLQNALELYYADHGRYPPPGFNAPPPPFGMNCWDCTNPSFRDNGRMAALQPYLNPRPSDPQPHTGQEALLGGYWYKVSPNGQDYKAILLGTIEDIDHVPASMVDSFFGAVGYNFYLPYCNCTSDEELQAFVNGLVANTISVSSSAAARAWQFNTDPASP